jgi:CHAT domain-containing protein
MFGGFGGGGAPLPRIVQVSITRPSRALPAKGAALPFVVSIHEEASAVSWRRDVTIDGDDEALLVEGVDALGRWSQGLDLTEAKVRKLVGDIGTRLWKVALGESGADHLSSLAPTAILLGVDETVLNLPWELIGATRDELALAVPFGRVVSTAVRPRTRRDPLSEDRTVRILLVENPSDDLSATEAEVEAVVRLAGERPPVTVEVEQLRGTDATKAQLADAVRDGSIDLLHFAGHARFDDRRPGTSGLLLHDGELTADDVLELPWASPPYLMFNSACESARSGRGRRLVSRSRQSAGLPAAALAAGVQGYLGHFFPVDDHAAGAIAGTFYEALFGIRNVGRAVQEARRAVRSRYDDAAELSSFGLTYFGDAGGADRGDLVEMAPPPDDRGDEVGHPTRADLATAV